MCIAGVDRDWTMLNPNTVATEIYKAGPNWTSIEMVANDEYFGHSAEDERQLYYNFVKEHRAKKIGVFVCLWNDWADNKYIPAFANAYLDIILKAGPEGVIIQPVGETHTAKGAEFEKKAFAALKAAGFKTC